MTGVVVADVMQHGQCHACLKPSHGLVILKIPVSDRAWAEVTLCADCLSTFAAHAAAERL